LDEFYFDTVGIQKYEAVAYVLKLILTLSHGQASVERGFSHNNALLKTNMTPETIISKRIIKDHMLFHKLKPHTVEVSDALVKSFKGAHMKYKLHLAEKKEKQVLSGAENKALHISNDIEKLRSNVRVMEKAVSMMNAEIFECMELTEKKKDLSYVIKGNGLKRKCEKTQGDISLLQNEIDCLEEKKHKLKQ